MTSNSCHTVLRAMRRTGLALLVIMSASAAIAAPGQAATLGVSVTRTPQAMNDKDQWVAYATTATNKTVAGDVLTCQANTWTGTPAPTFTYQWMGNGVSLGAGNGAQTSTYTVQAADAGTALQCVVTGTNTTNGGTSTSAVSAQTTVSPLPGTIPPEPATRTAATSRPTITPTAPTNATAGTVLTCAPPAAWNGSPTYTYQWLRNGTAIGSATNPTYTVVAADAGKVLQCKVVGTNAGGSSIGISLNRLTSGGATTLTAANSPTNSAANTPSLNGGTVTLAFTTQAAVHPQSLAGTGWTCVVASSSCTRTDLPPGSGDYPNVAAGFRIDEGGPTTITSSASLTLAGSTTASTSDTVDRTHQEFGLTSFTTSVQDEAGNEDTQAGSHPFLATTSFTFATHLNADNAVVPTEHVHGIVTDLPPGFLGNPQTQPTCATVTMVKEASCPVESAVGQVTLTQTNDTNGGAPSVQNVILYNLEPEKGAPAEFAFSEFAAVLVLKARVRSDGDYGLTIEAPSAPETPELHGISLTFCGSGANLVGTFVKTFDSCKKRTDVGATARPFLTNPSECSDTPPVTRIRVNSAENGGVWREASAVSPKVTGCDLLRFDPSISVTPETTRADTPSGYDVHVGVPQADSPETLGTPPLRDATVTLPRGVSLSPGTAEGLQGCTDDQLGLHSVQPATCPLASKIGKVHIATPVLPSNPGDYIPDGVTHYQLSGSIFLRKPDPGATRESLYSIFLDIEDEQTGITVKLRGNVVPDPDTGQLTARFEDNPQLPFTDFLLEFKGGDRAPLTNPMECGQAETTSTMSSWGGPEAHPTSSFTVDWDGNGGACPESLPFAPSFSAGTVDPLAGAFSPFTMTIKRDDRQQIMSGIDVDMPSGLLGMIGSVPLCGEDDAAAGTCGDASQIGSTTVSAGAGGHPFSLPGKVFVAGPYKGQPFSLSIVVRAIAGPFDLGTVVVRAPIIVDAANAKLRVPADALPTILEGVPLRLRMINILLDRPQFMFNATNCNPQQVGANLSSLQGTVASVSAPYQASNCAALPFHPSFKAKSDGRLKFKNGAALNVNITQQPGEAAIKSVAVTLPKQLPSRLIPTINNACVQSVFEENPANCPEDSYIGTTTATTPVFPDPLTGPVYVIARAKEVPQIVIILHGQGIAKGIDLKMYGDIIIDSGGGRSKSTFHMVPDVPISSFGLNLPAGPHSILDAPTYDVCQGPLKMGVNIVAQNGKRQDSNETVQVDHCPKIPAPKVLKTWNTKRGIAVKTLVPSLGRLVVSGGGLVPVARKAVKRSLITATAPYTPAMRSAVKRGARKMRVKVWFQPNNAAKPSSRTVTVKVPQRKQKPGGSRRR